MPNFAQGVYRLENPDKYVGRGSPRYRSGWEHSFFFVLRPKSRGAAVGF